MLPIIFVIAMVVCVVGLIRPFKGIKRKHFGWGLLASFVLFAVTVPSVEEQEAERLAAMTPEERAAEELKKKEEAERLAAANAEEIEKLKTQAAALEEGDASANLRVYERLVELDPENAEFEAKRAKYAEMNELRRQYESDPKTALAVVDMRWSKGGFDNVMIIDSLVVENKAPIAMKDFDVLCVHSGPSGTEMDRNSRTIYEIVPAGSTSTFREINMGIIHSQAVSSRCEISDAKIM